MIEICLPGDPVGQLSPNLRLHYLERHRRQQDWQGRAWRAWMAAGRPRIACRVTLTAIIRRARKVDPDNAAAALASIWNGLKDQPGRQALLPDDSDQWVSHQPVVFETGKQWQGKEAVLVRVEAVED